MKQLRRFSVPSFFVTITHPAYSNKNDPDCRILPNSMIHFPKSPPRSTIKYGISILCNTKHASNYLYDNETFADYTFYVDKPPRSTLMTFDSDAGIKSKVCWVAATLPERSHPRRGLRRGL
ncbi:uncharacterized protein LOC125945528 isoform X4 [Dermacentor silvarum]|uniref:uncharacterized protein LOC125945528 isoform X4 n=1 Tax=Dermacentor silvarum TaxID=543639 RepID=UPI0021014D70|nr:uncharacterized protein LOC125945528 isoform X4 [Dermacentor silvarum]